MEFCIYTDKSYDDVRKVNGLRLKEHVPVHEYKIIQGDAECVFKMTVCIPEKDRTLNNLLIMTNGTFYKLVKNEERLLTGRVLKYYEYINGSLFAKGFLRLSHVESLDLCEDEEYVREGVWTYYRPTGVYKISYLSNLRHGWCISLLNDGTIRQSLYENDKLVGKRLIREGITVHTALRHVKLMKWGDPVLRLA